MAKSFDIPSGAPIAPENVLRIDPDSRRNEGDASGAEHVRRRFLDLCKKHPSFTDPFWDDEVSRLTQAGGEDDMALMQEILQAQREFRLRDDAIEQVLELIPVDIHDRGEVADRISRTAELFLLRAALRKHIQTLADIAHTLEDRSAEPELSEARGIEIARHVEMLRHPTEEILPSVSAPVLQSDAVRPDNFEENHDDIVTTPIDVRFGTDIERHISGLDSASSLDVEDDIIDVGRDTPNEHEQIAEKEDRENIAEYERQLRRSMGAWRVAAERTITQQPDIQSLTTVLESTEDAIANECETAQSYVSELPDFHFSPEEYAQASSEELVRRIAQDNVRLSRASAVKHKKFMHSRRNEPQETWQDYDHLEESFHAVAITILGLRVRCELYREFLLEAEARRVEWRIAAAHEDVVREVPHTYLGIPAEATRHEIERGYAAATAMLDPDHMKDHAEIARAQHAQDVMLHGVQAQEQAAVLRAKQSLEGESVTNTHVLPSDASQKKPEGILQRIARAPGRWFRALFFGAALGAVGTVAVDQLTDNAPTQQDIGQGDDGHKEDGSEDAQVVAIELPTEAQSVDQKVTHVVDEHETMWGIATEMLQRRGVKPTNARVSYVTHVVREANADAVPVPEAMRPGTILDVTPAAEAIDEMLGIVKTQETSTQDVAHGSETHPGIASVDDAAEHTQTPVYESVHTGRDTPSERATIHSAEMMRDTIRVMKKGDRIYTMVYALLREQGLNWTSERVNLLTQLVLEDNAENFRAMVARGEMREMKAVYLPVGAKIDMKRAMIVIDDMAKRKQEGKKGKTVKQIAQEQGLPYPIVVKFPS